MSDYIDCELHVTDRDQAVLDVSGREYSGRPELGEALQERLRTLLDAKEYGSELFSGLFSLDGELLSGYRQALSAAQDAHKRLRFRLRIAANAPTDLHALRWELLYDKNKSVALGCSRELAFSRYSSIPELQGDPVKEKPRLLVAIAAPSDLSEYGLSEIDRNSARRAIENALSPLSKQMSWDFLWEPGQVTAANLSDRLAEGKFHALHLQAHGVLRDQVTAAVLEGEDGRADFVDEETFAQIFEGTRTLRLVTLVSCHGGMQSAEDPFSGLGPGLVRCGIPAVVAMRQSISVSTAARFCEQFYRNLARSGCVDKAVNEARHQLRLLLRGSADWGTPVLFMRLRDGLLWEPREPQEPQAAAEQIQAEEKESFNWSALLDCIATDGLLPFIGPDVYQELLLSREEIARAWIGKYHVPPDQQRDLAAVAQFVEAKEGTGRPHDLLLRLLAEDLPRRDAFPDFQRLQGRTLSEVISTTADSHFARHPEEPHLILGSLPLSTYVTTNPDSFLVEALRRRGSAPIRQHCLWRDDMRDPTILERYRGLRGTLKEPLVFHLYGSDEDPTSLVLTEDNHLDFLRAIANDPGLLPVHLQSSLTKSMLIFLGYDLRRLDSRVLLRGLLAHRKDLRRERYAVLQIDPVEGDSAHIGELRSFLESCCHHLQIRIYWGSVGAFLTELRERWNREARHGRA